MYLPQFKLSKLAAGVGSVLWFMAYAPQLQAQPRQIAPMIPLASTWPESVDAMMARMHRDWPLGTRVVVSMADSERGKFTASGRVFKHDRSWGGASLTVHFDRLVELDNWIRWCHTIPLECVKSESAPDAYCVTEANGDCASDDPRCMHNRPEPTDISDADYEREGAAFDAWRTSSGTDSGGPLSSNLPRNVSAAEPFGGPDYPDGYDSEGFPGGDARFAVRAETVFHHATGSPDALPNETPPGYTHVFGVGDYPTAYVERCDAERGEGMHGLCEDEGCPHSAVAHVCVEAEPDRAWVKSAVDAHAVLGTEFVVDYGTDPDASPGTGEAAAKYDRVRATRQPEPLTDAEHAELNEMLVELRAKPKRVRVRTKPLTAADIVKGGEYVPKRGNDKTPNLIVAEVWAAPAFDEPEPLETHVSYDRKGVREVVTMADFLALVARRVSA